MTTTSTEDLIRAKMQEHRDRVASLQKATAPQREQRDALLRQREEIDAQVNALTSEIRAQDADLVAEKKGIAACARALGAKSLSDA